MSLRVTITRYDDVLANPDTTVQWQKTHRSADSLRALELVGDACRGSLADETTYEVVNEATGRTFTSGQLARVAYSRTKSDTTHRERFARWFVDELREILFPWDDAVSFSVPPEQYWPRAACWALRVFGPTIEPWLVEDIAATYGEDFTTWVARHAADEPACWHCRSRRPRATVFRS